jgi:two-component system, NtrC family, sensor kinase
MAALGRLAARVAHELNNPLDGILRYVNLAMRVNLSGGGDPRVGDYLEKARGGLLRMAQITTALLEFSRSSHAPPEQATLNTIVNDAIAAMAGRAADAGVTVDCRLNGDDLPVARGSNIFQVFCNLIKNAIDAMPTGGTLTVTTSMEAGDVVIAFEDTGIGLPEDADRIFEPFFTTKEPGRGTGLGLAVCKEIIERYGGSIVAQRRQPAGTAFVVRIPEKNCGGASVTAANAPAASERIGELGI